MGPAFVTADEVPPGGSGLRLQTRLNGKVVQDAKTDEMIYGVAFTISFLSQAFTLSLATSSSWAPRRAWALPATLSSS